LRRLAGYCREAKNSFRVRCIQPGSAACPEACCLVTAHEEDPLLDFIHLRCADLGAFGPQIGCWLEALAPALNWTFDLSASSVRSNSTNDANLLWSPSAFSRSSTAFGATILARPIRLVQFEQRSGDKLRGPLSLVCGHRIWALAYCPYCPLIPEFGYIRWKIWKRAKEWTVRKDSKFCDLR